MDLIFQLIPLIILSIAIYQIIVLIRVRNWPKVEVKNINCEVIKRWETESYTDSNGRSSSRSVLRHYIVAEYDYEVDGVTYTNNKITPFEKKIKIPLGI